jgi:IS5 family transposase
MRAKFNTQSQFSFQPSTLKVTNEYYARYARISAILDQNPEIVEAVHAEIQEPVREELDVETGQVRYRCCTETLLRIVICQNVEGHSLRDIAIRVDDSYFLRWFVRIYNDAMIDYSTLCRLRNRIRPETWKRIHECLNRWAVANEYISGQRLRLDTTAVETNIHWPTDSGLLWDSYRVLARLVRRLRKRDRGLVAGRRLHLRRTRRLYLQIARRARGRAARPEALKPLYSRLIRQVQSLHAWVDEILASALFRSPAQRTGGQIEAPLEQLGHYRALSERVVDQARRRTVLGEAVPNHEKLFSLFEPHTELLKRGKAARNIEFGHMIQIQQVEGKFITAYEVFQNKPNEAMQLEPTLENHRALFGEYPQEVSADKGYAQSAAQLERLAPKVKQLAVSKAGRSSQADRQREHAPCFRMAQRFRAGIEGTISFLKRTLGLARCLAKGWPRYAAAIGAALFTHNLLILARA